MTQTAPPTAESAPTRAPRSTSRRLRGAGIALAAVVATLVVLSGGLALAHRGEALPGITVAGVDVGGMSRGDATAALADLTEARRHDPVIFEHGADRFTYVPGDETYAADLDTAVDAVMRVGRDGGFLRAGWGHLSSLWVRAREVELPDDVHVPAVRAWVAEVAEQVDRPLFAGAVSADPATLQVRIEQPADGVQVVADDAVTLALGAIREPGPVTRTLPTEVLAHDVDEDSVQALGATVRRALEEPMVLTADGAKITLSPAELATVIRSRAVADDDGRRSLVLFVRSTDARELFADHRDLTDRAPREARFELVSGLRKFDGMSDVTFSPSPAELDIVDSRDGTELSPALAARQLAALMEAGERGAELELRTVHPELSTQEARDLNVTHLIGTFTTYHPCCRNRVRNIQRMADIVRGAVIRPGETFSINEHVGRRTSAGGFVADGTIVGGEYVDEVGGGVSQFATTMYNAAFFAGLQIPEHKAHSYYISRYPIGREATLYFPSVDLKVRNDTDNGVFIHTSYTGKSITVSLFGNNGGLEVSAVHGKPTNHRSHRTIYRENKSLRPGSSRVVQQGGRGFDVTVTRVLRSPGGDERSERIFTRYQAPIQIIERNTSPPPRPKPSPSPSPSGGDGSGGTSGNGGNGNGGGNGGEPADEG